MLHALLQVVCTEMCIGSVCKQPPYNDTNYNFYNLFKCFAFLKSSRLSV